MKTLFLCTVFALALSTASAANWAVIIAGSKGFANYRHQADACHAYQIVKKGGIPESNIILMMQDDVANARENPFPGKLFNKPTAAGVDGVDVYEGCKIDYRGSQVTGKTFLAVLEGDAKTAGGKVLKSTANDKVFVNFADHGGVGLIAMPNGPFLYAADLNKSLQKMHDTKMYSELVFYLEACESGSMFQGHLPTNINIFATTAANAKESSWGTYCPPKDLVNGKHVGSCLGDLYSVNWMEDSDKAASQSSETLIQQFNKVKSETNKSHCMQFGTTTFDSEPIHDFQGVSKTLFAIDDASTPTPTVEDKLNSAVSSRDIGLVTDFYAYLRAPAGERAHLAKALVAEIEHRETADEAFAKLSLKMGGLMQGEHMLRSHTAPANLACQRAANEAVQAKCGQFSDYSLKYSRVIVNLCEAGHSVADITAAAASVCA